MSIPVRTTTFSFDMSTQLFSRTLGGDWDKSQEVMGDDRDNKIRVKLMVWYHLELSGCPKPILRTCNNDDRDKPEWSWTMETMCTAV
jgi:hypothetical protein